MTIMTLKAPFTDIEVEGQYVASPFVVGDVLTVYEVRSTCPDPGCCETWYHVAHPGFNGGQPFWAAKYYDSTEIV